MKKTSFSKISCLFAGNIPFLAKAADIKEFFAIFGKVLSVNVPSASRRSEPYRNRGIAFIYMETPVVEKLLKTHGESGTCLTMNGRELHLNRAPVLFESSHGRQRNKTPEIADKAESTSSSPGFAPSFRKEFPWIQPLSDGPQPWREWTGGKNSDDGPSPS